MFKESVFPVNLCKAVAFFLILWESVALKFALKVSFLESMKNQTRGAGDLL